MPIDKEWSGRANEPLPQGADYPALYYEDHQQLRDHLAAFLDAYNFVKRLKTLQGLTPYEAICKAWTDDPERSDTILST